MSSESLTPTATSPPLLSFLAFDFGSKRVGVATGNTLTRSATPLRTVAVDGELRFAAIAALITEWQPDALVVGVPFHPDGAPHDNTARARRFARQLHGRFRLPVHEVDERYSTTEAASGGARDLDAASAAIILNQFLSTLE
jgi:putative Holliday junction resolvase